MDHPEGLVTTAHASVANASKLLHRSTATRLDNRYGSTRSTMFRCTVTTLPTHCGPDTKDVHLSDGRILCSLQLCPAVGSKVAGNRSKAESKGNDHQRCQKAKVLPPAMSKGNEPLRAPRYFASELVVLSVARTLTDLATLLEHHKRIAQSHGGTLQKNSSC